MDAEPSGETYCNATQFDAKLSGGSCFCEAPLPPEHNFCDKKDDVAKEVGCYEDKIESDFEELLSTSILSVEECLQLVFDSHYQYAGL